MTITRFVEIDNPESLGEDGAGDYYPNVQIHTFEGEEPFGTIESDDFSPNWTFTKDIDLSVGQIQVQIEIFDQDDNSADEKMDISPAGGGDTALTLTVDLRTGMWRGDGVTFPQNFAQGNGDTDVGKVFFDISIPGITTDRDGDGLLDGWETNGIDTDGNLANGPELNLPLMGADPDHKDLFLELDWMDGAAPNRDEIQALKAAFAVAPFDAGTDASALPNGVDARPNPDGRPGINLWVDTGPLTDARGRLVGDNLGGGNRVPTANVSGLTSGFYDIKNATDGSGRPINFDPARAAVFHYAISANQPANNVGRSTGGNGADGASNILNDAGQAWLPDEWKGRTVTITAGRGAGQPGLTVVSNTANQLVLNAPWAVAPDATSQYRISLIGGRGMVGGSDFIDYNHNAVTFMHELGHNLNLRHGGFENTNGKPNYVSVMNYAYQGGVPQNSGGTVLDYSPAKVSFGGNTTGNNTATSLNDTNQAWTPGQWAGGYIEIGPQRGISSGGGATTLTDAAQNWATNELTGLRVGVPDGAGGVQFLRIVSNTANTLTVSAPWAAVPVAGTQYTLALRQVRQVASNTATRLTFTDPWTFIPAAGTPYALYKAIQQRAAAPLPPLVEDTLLEAVPLDPTDAANRMIFSDNTFNPAAPAVVQYPLNGIDRDGNGPRDGPDYVRDGVVQQSPVAVNVNARYDSTTGNQSSPLTGQDDWRRISLPFLQFGRSGTGEIEADDDPLPTLDEVLQASAAMNTADLSLSVTPSSSSVVQGDHLVYTYTVAVNGPNPADGVVVTTPLPFGAFVVSATSSQGTVRQEGITTVWDLGPVYPGVPIALRLELIPLLAGDLANTAAVSTIDFDPAAVNDFASAAVTVLNAPPRITSVGLSGTSLNENDEVELAVAFADPGLLDTHTVEIDWGDGPAEVVPIPPGDRGLTVRHRYLDDNPTNTTSDTYPIRVSVRDDNGGSDSAETAASVANLVPVLSNLAVTAMTAEDGLVTLTGDIADTGTLDTFTLTIDWGDGVPEAYSYPVGTTRFSVTHQYLDDNPTGTPRDTYTVRVALTDDDDGQATASVATVVNNVAPQLRGVTVTPTVDENGTVTLGGSFLDPGTEDTFTLVVEWGEGGPQVVPLAAGVRSFSVTHQYLDDNPTGTPRDTYTVRVALTDDDDGQATASVATVVNNVAPVLTALASSSPSSAMVAEGDTVTVTGAFTDVGTRDTHTVTVDWADGTVTTAAVTEAGGSGTFVSTHAYRAGGVYPVRVTVRDDDAGAVEGSKAVFITGVGVQQLGDQRVLFVVGSNGDDQVTINPQGKGYVVVNANFLQDGRRTVTLAGIDVIDVVLGSGNDQITVAGGVPLPTVIDGGDGDDRLDGGQAGNVLVGGRGNDFLIGGGAPDILIGGLGADRLVGNGGDDVLVGGLTGYDSGADDDKLANDRALLALLKEWSSDRTYAERVTNLRTGTGPVLGGLGLALRASATVWDDQNTDTLTGSAELDWWFYDPFRDVLTDHHDGEDTN